MKKQEWNRIKEKMNEITKSIQNQNLKKGVIKLKKLQKEEVIKLMGQYGFSWLYLDPALEFLRKLGRLYQIGGVDEVDDYKKELIELRNILRSHLKLDSKW